MIGGLDAVGARQMIERNLIFLHPLRVRLPRGQMLFDFLVGNQALLLGVDQQHAARREPALHAHVLGLDRQHSRFRRHHHQSVVGDEVPSRAQAVAIELRADHAYRR